MGKRCARHAWDVHVVDVHGATETGRCIVSLYDPENDQGFDVAVCYVPDSGIVEIAALNARATFGLRITQFVETDREVCDLVAARVREAMAAYDPR